MNKNFLWRFFYADWEKPKGPRTPGYTLLLMVPGDLPVFLQIAMEVCSSQRSEHMVEAVVVPDNLPARFMDLFQSLKKTWNSCPIRVAPLRPIELLITRKINNPHTNCWLQFVRGCNEARSTHLLWHDADLFLADPGFLEKHYAMCTQTRCVLRGVSESWDAWYRENGFAYLTSTWETMLDLEWVRSFKPWQHRGHDGHAGGKPHAFDITFLPQCLTSAERIQRHNGDWGVHFNHVIATYRRFQNSRGPYEDVGFKLLLVRLLVDAYDRSGWSYEVPSFENLLKGVHDASQRVTYRREESRKNYPEFRAKFQKLIDSGVTGPARERVLREETERFDCEIGWK